MTRRLLTILLFLFPVAAMGQTVVQNPDSNTTVINKGSYRVDKKMIIPHDTLSGGNVAIVGGNLYFYNGSSWQLAGRLEITDLIQPGTNVSITGNGTPVSPYVINSTGGGSSDTTQILFGKLEVNGSGATYTLPNAPIQNSVIATVNGKSENVSFPTATQVQINAAYTIDAGDKVKITYTYYP